MGRFLWLFFCMPLLVRAAGLDDELLAAARRGDLSAVQMLCEKGAALEAKTPYGQTPLYLAAMNGHAEVVRFLLEKGANSDVKDTFYKAPMLGFVLQRKHYDVAKLLIEKSSASPDALLPEVAQSPNAGLVDAVLAKGKVSQPLLDSVYESALERKQVDVAELLKKAGANEPAPAVMVDPKVLDTYAGTYKTDQISLEIKVFVKEGKLYVQATGQPEFAPKPLSPTSFTLARIQLRMDFDAPGSFRLKQGGREFTFKRAVSQ